MQLQSPCADSVVTAVTSGLVAKMEAAMLPSCRVLRIWVAAVARSVSLVAWKLRDSPLMHRFGHDFHRLMGVNDPDLSYSQYG